MSCTVLLNGLEDHNFEQQLDQDKYACLWEMMVVTILTAHGYRPKRAECGPDFVVERGSMRIFIEAICPSPGNNASPDSIPPTVDGAGIAQDLPEHKVALRLCHALLEKKRKFIHYRDRGLVSASDAYIVAINSSKIDGAYALRPSAIMRATHGLGNPYVVFDRSGPVAEGIECGAASRK